MMVWAAFCQSQTPIQTDLLSVKTPLAWSAPLAVHPTTAQWLANVPLRWNVIESASCVSRYNEESGASGIGDRLSVSWSFIRKRPCRDTVSYDREQAANVSLISSKEFASNIQYTRC